jgi:hypothetical protein
MVGRDLVYGLLDTSATIHEPSLAAKCRELTLTWSRYDYRGPIIEQPTIDAILDQAAREGYRHCFIQSYGQIIRERWVPTRGKGESFLSTLKEWIAAHDSLVAGRILTAPGGWYGLDHRLLLVDLHRYAECGAPSFGRGEEHACHLPVVSEIEKRDHVTTLIASEGTHRGVPRLDGWRLIRASLDHGIPVVALSEDLRNHILDLAPEQRTAADALLAVLEDGIDSYRGRAQYPGLTDDQATLLATVRRQTANARRGVFLMNIEGYDDVDTPPPGFRPPVSSLYSVASGFKPNRILQTHGMDSDTRVVFFDYSLSALSIRRTMVEQWDGEDFPRFVRHLLEAFPPETTFYQLWAGATPDNMDWAAVEELWRRETARFGGERAFSEHWREYRSLRHRYVHCDILVEPEELLAEMPRETSAVMWFSNAPFTMYSNWRYSLAERRARYERWIERLVGSNPHMLLYGSDYNNSNVNCVRAGDYWTLFQEEDGGPLAPPTLFEHEIRM